MAVTRTHRAWVAAIVVGIALVAGCARGPDTPTATVTSSHDAHVPAEFDTTFRWIAGPALDMSSPEGTFVRAYVESFELANAGGSVQWGYRGFVQASPSNIDQMILAYPSGVSAGRHAVGTAFFTSLRRIDGVDRTRIVLCRYGYRSVRDGDAWVSKVDDPHPVEIDFRREGATPPTAASGRLRTPETAVFGGWYTTRYDFAAVYPTPTADQHACAATVPDASLNRGPARGDQPWPTMAPSPGWSGRSVV
ncbi:hypothetical protein [Gordonia sp. ABSL49_1]|uniref:hypothetical protein n=1 Tax=unclassified Gordonia (in: high G+C Gram-positive bacteria) TaxID=2657482 RepID=UPI001F11665D|nr:hypothetical protein [Gordonia sp. ABSL49_1]MCH5643627.1 hypothetical protein [Gordonia sp. ABSL49_1]